MTGKLTASNISRYLGATAAVLLSLLLFSCKTPKLSEANAQFNRGEYFDAAKTYRAVYGKLKPREDRALRGEVAYQLATCYRRLNMAARASGAYQNAIRYDYPDSTAWFYLGRSLQMEGKYQPAIDAYTKFLEFCPDDALAKEDAWLPTGDPRQDRGKDKICGEGGKAFQFATRRFRSDVSRQRA